MTRRVAIVPQDAFLFDRSVGENIALGREGAGPDEVSAVLKRLDRAAASRGVDLDPETVELGQLLLEGAPRVALRPSS